MAEAVLIAHAAYCALSLAPAGCQSQGTGLTAAATALVLRLLTELSSSQW